MKTLLYTGCHSNKSALAPGCTVVLHWKRNRMGAVPIHTAGCSDKGAVWGIISCCTALLQPLLRNRCGTGSYISSGLALGFLFQRAKLLSKYKAWIMNPMFTCCVLGESCLEIFWDQLLPTWHFWALQRAVIGMQAERRKLGVRSEYCLVAFIYFFPRSCSESFPGSNLDQYILGILVNPELH